MTIKFNVEKFLETKVELKTDEKTSALPLNHDPIRTKMILDHVPLIKFITTQIVTRLPSHIDHKDLFSAGMMGLMDAIDKYDPARDNKFKTYAEFRIRGAILDELRSQDWLPRSAREVNKKDRHAQITLEHQLGRKPSAFEIANFLNITLDEYQSQLSRMSVSLVSIEDLSWTNLQDEKMGLEIVDNEWAQNPFSRLNALGIQSIVAKAIGELPQKQRLVLEMYYYKDLSLKEIGNLLELTESRVSQLHTAAIRRMKKKLKDILTE